MKLLKDNGYKRFKTKGKDDVIYPYSECFYQKRFTDKKGVKYHIQFVCYANSKLNLKESWLLDFFTNEPFYTFRQHYVKLESKKDLKKIEQKVELFWKTFNCAYYELYS